MKAQRGSSGIALPDTRAAHNNDLYSNGSNEYAASIFRAEVIGVNMQFDHVLLSYFLLTLPVGSDQSVSVIPLLPI
jgi:hypothetical protein